MSTYVDGFLLPVPTANLAAYRQMAETGARVWLKHGALDYKECVGDDVNVEGMLSFVQAAGCKEDETPVFAFIVYKSREHRDEVNAKVMEDPELKASCGADNMPFDFKKMYYGGFKTLVDGTASQE